MPVLLLNSDKLVLAVGAGSETDGSDRGLPASAIHVRLPKSEPSVKHCLAIVRFCRLLITINEALSTDATKSYSQH